MTLPNSPGIGAAILIMELIHQDRGDVLYSVIDLKKNLPEMSSQLPGGTNTDRRFGGRKRVCLHNGRGHQGRAVQVSGWMNE